MGVVNPKLRTRQNSTRKEADARRAYYTLTQNNAPLEWDKPQLYKELKSMGMKWLGLGKGWQVVSSTENETLKENPVASVEAKHSVRKPYVSPPDFTLTGWLSPEGDYYPTQGWGYLHEELAQLICVDNNWNFEAVYGGTTAQYNLICNGFIRFDHYNIDFREQPTLVQIEEIRKMYQWKLDNPDAGDYRDYYCWQYIGEFLQWCDHDPALWYEDAESFDDKLKKRGQY